MDKILEELSNTYSFIDDLLIVTKANQNDHWLKVRNVLVRLDRMKIRLNHEKCEFAQWQAEWLGLHLSQTGIEPLNSKFQGITDRLKPKNLKEPRSFLGAVNHMNRLIPNVAHLCFPFRPLQKN